MIRPPDPAITPLPAEGSAEDVMLRLVYVVMGDGDNDHGLMTRLAQGRYHVPRCQSGMCVVQDDSMRGGQPCSDRCLRAQDALRRAAVWLYEHRPPTQMPLLEVAV